MANRGPQFDQHIRTLQWRQGEHVFVSGATGSGKTLLARHVVERRSHAVGFCIKFRDPTIEQEYKDWNIVGSWDEVEPWMNKVMIWPRLPSRAGGDAVVEHQRKEIRHAFDRIMVSDNWCVFVDELNYMCRNFGVQGAIESLHFVGRSSGISLVTAAQRPAYVPLAVLSSASHAYIARTRLKNDLTRLSDFGDIDQKKVAAEIVGLKDRHDFLYIPVQAQGVSTVVNVRR